ncbi:MAG: hypothetical protein U5S82_21100 [Gammaproteobacteria bacterium]|nr:hypothetical protein [Gammaproteobacteria bacterium]
MADFRRQKQFETREPQLKVEGGLPAGTYVFQLEVEDDSGNRSRAARVRVRILDPRNPVTPIDPGDLRIERPVIDRDSIVIRRPDDL